MPDHEAAANDGATPDQEAAVDDAAQWLGNRLLRWGGVIDDDDELTVDLEALTAFVDAVSDSSIREECRDIGADVGAP